MFIRSVLLISVTFLLNACAMPTVRKVSTFDTDFKSFSNYLILPAQAEIGTLDFNNNLTRNDNYEYFVEDYINEISPNLFNEIGLNSKFVSKAQLHDLKLSRYYSIISDSINDHLNALYGVNLKSKEAASNIDVYKVDYADVLNKNFNSDVIVLIKYNGYVVSTGKKMMQAFSRALIGISDNKADQFNVSVIMISPKTSSIIWTNRYNEFRGMELLSFDKKKADRAFIKSLLKSALLPLKSIK